jgi:hypothetical protein
MSDKRPFVERRPSGDYAAQRPDSDGASVVTPAQSEAIATAQEMDHSQILAERIRDTTVAADGGCAAQAAWPVGRPRKQPLKVKQIKPVAGGREIKASASIADPVLRVTVSIPVGRLLALIPELDLEKMVVE